MAVKCAKFLCHFSSGLCTRIVNSQCQNRAMRDSNIKNIPGVHFPCILFLRFSVYLPVLIAFGFSFRYFGTAKPSMNEKPMIKRFRTELRSTYWRLEIPTAAIIPNMQQKTPPITGWGMVENSAPNFPKRARIIMHSAPIWTTRRLPT